MRKQTGHFILSSYLAYAGTLPFIGCAVLLVCGVHTIPVLGNVEHVLATYGLLIASFMAGAHWGQHLHIHQPWRLKLPIMSNIITIAIWAGFLLLGLKAFLATLLISFLILLWIDKALCQQDKIDVYYFRTRCRVTAIVVSALIISGIAV